jgi:hypothetical protein
MHQVNLLDIQLLFVVFCLNTGGWIVETEKRLTVVATKYRAGKLMGHRYYRAICCRTGSVRDSDKVTFEFL